MTAALILASGCASARSRQAGFSIPPALEALPLDATPLPGGKVIFSLPEEETAMPSVEITARAWQALTALRARILEDRCAMRAQLQAANGGKAEPDGVCRSSDEPLVIGHWSLAGPVTDDQ